MEEINTSEELKEHVGRLRKRAFFSPTIFKVLSPTYRAQNMSVECEHSDIMYRGEPLHLKSQAVGGRAMSLGRSALSRGVLGVKLPLELRTEATRRERKMYKAIHKLGMTNVSRFPILTVLGSLS